jgi:Tol biopolymer transport system component
MVNADGTGYQQITNVEAHNYYPVYSPLGGSIVYASNQNGGFFDLFLFVFEGSRLIRLTENIGNVLSPSFSPDGQTVLSRSLGCPDLRWAVRPAVVLSRPAVRAGRCHSPVQLPVTRLDPTTPQFHELRCITNRSGSPTVSAVVARASRLQRGQE